MMNKFKGNYLLEGGNLYDPYKDKKVRSSILIQNGKVKETGKISHSGNVKIINCKGKIISPGFIDIHAHFREPGRENQLHDF